MFVLEEEVKHILLSCIAGARYGIKIRFPHALIMTLLFRKDLSATDKLRSIVKLTIEHATNLAAFATLYKSLLATFKLCSIGLIQLGENHSSSSCSCSSSTSKIVQRFFQVVRTIIVGNSSLVSMNELCYVPPPPGQPVCSQHALLAGSISGYFVWGRYSSINYQIVLYLTSRVLVGIWKRSIMMMMMKNNTNDKRLSNDRNELYNSNKLYPFAAAAVWGLVMMLFEECPEVLHPSLKNSMDEIYKTKNMEWTE